MRERMAHCKKRPKWWEPRKTGEGGGAGESQSLRWEPGGAGMGDSHLEF